MVKERAGNRRRKALSLLAITAAFGASQANATPQAISTIAGSFRSDGVAARASTLGSPADVATDASGAIFIADGYAHQVRRIDSQTGLLTTYAGSGTYWHAPDGGLARDTPLRKPNGVAIDNDGNLIFSDADNNLVHRVDRETGILTTIAGREVDDTYTTVCVSGGDGLQATMAGVCRPAGLAVDRYGNVFIAEGTKIRRVDAATGAISTVAGSGVPGYTLLGVTNDVTVPLSDTGDGGPATLARLLYAQDVAVDSGDNLYIADGFSIRRVDAATGIISRIAGTGECLQDDTDDGAATETPVCNPASIVIDPSGAVVFSDTFHHRVRRIDPVTGMLTTLAGNGTRGFGGDGAPAGFAFDYPSGVAFGPSGRMIVSTAWRAVVVAIDAQTQTMTLVAGEGRWCGGFADGVPATDATLCSPAGMTLAPDGGLVFADQSNNRIRRIDPTTGIIATIAGNGIYDSALGDGMLATDARLDYPADVAYDAAGNLYISDRFNYRIRRVDAITGIIWTVAGGGEGFGFTGDGGPASSATLWAPHGIEIGPDGRLYIADALNMRIRRVDLTTGIITTVAGGGAQTLATDIALQGSCSNVAAGDGGPATLADLCAPLDLVFDHAGNMVIADSSNDRVRRVNAESGIITTIAGRTPGFSGDGGPATSADLSFVTGVAVDAHDNVYAVDYYNRRVRRIDAASGIITTVAGTGGQEYRGDGVPATAAPMGPRRVLVTPVGDLLISDGSNHRIRRVARN